MKIIVVLSVFCAVNSALAQDTTDAYLLKNQRYMIELAAKIDCENSSGTNAENRVCLNLEFQEKDSILNSKITEYLSKLSPDQQKTFLELHNQWLIYRRTMSNIHSEGFQGHLLGIRYLSTMIDLTAIKTSEINLLLESY